MLNVFITFDIEVWCGGWENIDAKFPDAYRRYIYGPTPAGDYGLPFQSSVMTDHGLLGVFFVEPLFSTRFGLSALEETIGLIKPTGHEIQLHLHTEWVDEAREALLPNVTTKRQFLRDFSISEQSTLIAIGKNLIEKAGGGCAETFRAGSFGFNRDTLQALRANNIHVDSSYNACMFGLDSGVCPGTALFEPIDCDGVSEFPMTVYDDGIGSRRHAQVTACSFREIEGLLWQALESRRKAFVILSHNFELLNKTMDRPDRVVVERFLRLCAFLERNRDCFNVRGFRGAPLELATSQPAPLKSSVWNTGQRMFQQFARRRFG